MLENTAPILDRRRNNLAGQTGPDERLDVYLDTVSPKCNGLTVAVIRKSFQRVQATVNKDTSVRRVTQIKKAKARRGANSAKTQDDRLVLVLDDDPSVLGAICRLIRSAGFKVRAFSHPQELISQQLPTQNVCLVADIYLPQMNGVELCHALAVGGRPLPTILITGRNDELTQRLIEKSEAFMVLFKPVDEVPLLDAITRCLDQDRG